MWAREKDLMVFLRDVLGIGEDQFRDERAPLEHALVIEIGDVADDQIVAIETDRETLLDETTKIVVTTDQFLKH